MLSLYGLRLSPPSRARVEEYATLLPFGDQIGSKLVDVVSLVRGKAPVPSALLTQILKLKILASLPSRARFEEYASLLPSGDHLGNSLFAFVSLVTGMAP